MSGLVALGIIIIGVALLVLLGYRLRRREHVLTAVLYADPPKSEPEPVPYSPVPLFKTENLAAAAARGWDTPAADCVTERWVGLPPFEPACRGVVRVIAVEADRRIKMPSTIEEGDIVYCTVYRQPYIPIDDELVLVALPSDHFVIRPWHGREGQEQVLGTVIGIARWDV